MLLKVQKKLKSSRLHSKLDSPLSFNPIIDEEKQHTYSHNHVSMIVILYVCDVWLSQVGWWEPTIMVVNGHRQSWLVGCYFVAVFTSMLFQIMFILI